MKRRFATSLLVLLLATICITAADAALVLELRPQDYNGTQWPIYQGSLKDADVSKAYFAPSGTPKLIPSVAGTKYSGIAMNTTVWDQCLGFGGPIAPASITGDTTRTIEAWSYNPALAGEETLVELSHNGGTTGQNFAMENGGSWALKGGGSGDVTDWVSSSRQNRWVHLVVSYSAGVAKFYVDGVNTVTKTTNYNIFAGDSIAIGAQRSGATTASNSIANLNVAVYIGYIGNVRVYDNALSAAEVTSRFALGVNGGETQATTYAVTGQVNNGSTGIAGSQVYFSTSPNASLSPNYVATTDASGNYSQVLPAGQWYIASSKARYTPNPTADTSLMVSAATSGVNFSLTYVTTPTKLIDMDGATLTGADNDAVTTWTNSGTLGGAFAMDGTDATTKPVLATTLGKRCLIFDGTNDRLKLLNGSTPITAPAGITGNSDWTICGWYLNPSLGSTEAIFGWANSGNREGARCGFMYGSHNGDGAVMHGASPWLNANMAMIPLPTSGLWHHITVSFDGTVEKVYVDGVVNQTENKNLRIGAADQFSMGTWYAAASGSSPSNYCSGSIASLTVYDQVLTDAEINSLGFQQTYTISGTVKDDANQAISGVNVYFKTSANASADPVLVAVTNSSGGYTQQVPPGIWYISAMKSRYSPNPAEDLIATVTSGNATGKNFTLTPDATLHKLIDLSASTLATGTLASWTNIGSLGGSFAQDGTDATTNPTVTTVAGRKAVTFDGSNDRLKASFTAPAGITSGSDWTVSAVVYNPAVASEEAYLCWAQRGTASRASEFSYGSTYSAYHVTNNMAWASVPVAGIWHHVAVTYDGSIEKTYVDGVVSAQSSARTLNIWPGQPILIGVAYDNATATSRSQWFSGSMTNLQVYDECLTETEIRGIATVTISGTVTGPTGNPLPGAVIGFKSTTKTTPGLAVSATADADIYVLADGAGNYSLPVLSGNSFYVAAWKDGYTASDDIELTADESKIVNIPITSEAGVNLAMGKTKETSKLYASPTGLGTNSVNLGFDGNPNTYFAWTTSSQKDLVIDVSKANGAADLINGVTLITSTLRVYNWELWTENNAAPIVAGTRNTGANWTKIYQSTGSLGGFDRVATNGQVVNPVKFAETSARGVWIKIITSSATETRPLEVMVHSSGGPVSIGSCKAQVDGSYVVISSKSVTWAPRDGNGIRSTDYFYVQDLGRTSGIRVKNPVGFLDTLKVNDLISVAGTMATNQITNERYIQASIVPSGTAGTGIAPFGMNTKMLQTDLTAVGQLVNVAGKVKSVAPDGSWFAISDGFIDAAGAATTRVNVKGIQLPTNLATVNDWITVTGVVGKDVTADGVKSVINLFNYAKPEGTFDEFTFICISDVHYGSDANTYPAAQQVIDQLNSLPGTTYPSNLGGKMQTPRGVIEIGDIAESGKATEFASFAEDYGINGECRLRYPVFEGLGNHDGRSDSTVGNLIKARNPLRRKLTGTSTNGLHYSWDWNGVHFVHLNRVPADVTESNPSGAMVGDPCYALSFLQADLAKNVGNSGRPVFIAHHYGMETDHSAGWWSVNERTLYYNAIKNYNIIGIAHGHKHSPDKYQWNGTTVAPTLPGGIDVYEDSAGYNKTSLCAGGFYVMRVRYNQLSYAYRYWDPATSTWKWGASGTKTITTPSLTP